MISDPLYKGQRWQQERATTHQGAQMLISREKVFLILCYLIGHQGQVGRKHD